MIKVLIYGPEIIELDSTLGSLNIFQTITNSENIIKIIQDKKIDIIIGWGPEYAQYLLQYPHEIIKKCFHFANKPSMNEIRNCVVATYNCSALTKHIYSDDNPYISIFTPTYNTGNKLNETYQYIANQTHKNWEWIIVDDGSTDDTLNIAKNISNNDLRVKVFAFDHFGRIGYLKKAAACLCSGEYLVELDHDDILTEDCLEEIIKTFKENPDVGMVYSNCAEWMQQADENNQPIPWEKSTNDAWNMYGADYWMYKDTEWNGKLCKEALQWDVNGYYSFYGNDGQKITLPVILSMPICPNHVRAFRSSEYHRIGCHRDLVYADDYDLMLRMFIHSKIFHIKKMLYIQRMFQNTWTRFGDYLCPMFGVLLDFYTPQLKEKFKTMGICDTNGTIQIPKILNRPDGNVEVFEIKDNKIYSNILENINNINKIEPKEHLKIDLGCGKYKANGFIGIDSQKFDCVDIIHDLEIFPWPFSDGSVDYIRAYHVFEHLSDVITTMNECYRILSDGGILELEVPTTDGQGAWSDPGHKSYWNADRLLYLCPEIDPVVFAYTSFNCKYKLEFVKHYEMRKNVTIMNVKLKKI